MAQEQLYPKRRRQLRRNRSPWPKGTSACVTARTPTRPALVFTPGEWTAFLDGVKADEFNDLN
jgi:hypothetical protein